MNSNFQACYSISNPMPICVVESDISDKDEIVPKNTIKVINSNYSFSNLFILLFGKAMYSVFYLLLRVVKPKYIVNEYGTVLELNYNNNTIKRVYPNPTKDIAKVNISEYLNNIHNHHFCSKKVAIRFSQKFQK